VRCQASPTNHAAHRQQWRGDTYEKPAPGPPGGGDAAKSRRLGGTLPPQIPLARGLGDFGGPEGLGDSQGFVALRRRGSRRVGGPRTGPPRPPPMALALSHRPLERRGRHAPQAPRAARPPSADGLPTDRVGLSPGGGGGGTSPSGGGQRVDSAGHDQARGGRRRCRHSPSRSGPNGYGGTRLSREQASRGNQPCVAGEARMDRGVGDAHGAGACSSTAFSRDRSVSTGARRTSRSQETKA
jgi:hypothetical protein